MATIRVDIVSAEGEIHSGEAKMVFAPARMGEVGISPRHAPLLTAKRGVGKDGHEMGLDFQHSAGDIEKMLLTIGVLDTNLARFQRGEQWRMAR